MEVQVMVDVIVFDKGNLIDIEIIVINVIDVVENMVLIGLFLDSDVVGNIVEENVGGGIVVGVIVFVSDFDVGDSVIYKIVNQNFLFEIDLVMGVVIVKDGVVIDREVMLIIDIKVQVILIDGLFIIKIFMVIVGDDIFEFFIGFVSDDDLIGNSIFELVGSGDMVGIIVFVEDKDVVDMVSYELIGIDGCFEIDEILGVIMVVDGVCFDVEIELMIDVIVKVILMDGLIVSKIFMIDVIDGNELLDFVVYLDNVFNELVVNGGFEIFIGILKGMDGIGWYDILDIFEGWIYSDVDVY